MRFLPLPICFAILFLSLASCTRPSDQASGGQTAAPPATAATKPVIAPTPVATPASLPSVATPEEVPEPSPAAAVPESDALPSVEALQPFRSSWIYPTILNFRPASGLESPVNPPRFSWPYLEEVVAEDISQIPPTVFTLQIARDAEFTEPEVEIIDTPYNFYNALAPLPVGTWFWRVGYGAAPDQAWSAARTFVIGSDSVDWDRTAINQAVEILAARPHPRSGPPDGDWAALYQRMKADPATARSADQMLKLADQAIKEPWWTDFPATDIIPGGPKNRAEQTRFIDILKKLTTVAYVYRLTGDPKFRPAIDHIIEMARWPQGGLLSPEGHLGGQTKMPSQAVELFAVTYDWFADDLDNTQKQTLRNAIAWRLRDMYWHPQNIIWQQGEDSMRHYGLAYVGGSHPYQNFAWTMPAILLMAGELDEADLVLPLALNYLTGVTAPDGPDEGYNEGHGYSNEKAETLLRAAVLTDQLLPELELGKNPVFNNLTDWFIFMFPGVERLPWGDSWLSTARGQGGNNLLRIAYLTGSPAAKAFWEERADSKAAGNPYGGYSRPWFEFFAWDQYQDRIAAIEDYTPSAKTLFLPEAGWLFVQSQPIGNYVDFRETVGMQFQMRPRGGYGHSYASDGSFVWYAYGQALSVGGGWRSWASLEFSRSPISHNALLINGRGHDVVSHYQPARPYTARPLVFETGENFVYWAADLTAGYRHLGPVAHVHRHVVFLDDRWFVIFDDLALPETADPATFSWLFHVYQGVPVEILPPETPGFSYSVGRTRALVRFANPAGSLTLENRQGWDGAVNPITGEDLGAPDRERAASLAIFKSFINKPISVNNLWISNAEPARTFQFVSVLAAAGTDMELPEVTFPSSHAATITTPDGKAVTVSFDPLAPGDITIDPARVRAHAVATEPAGD